MTRGSILPPTLMGSGTVRLQGSLGSQGEVKVPDRSWAML